VDTRDTAEQAELRRSSRQLARDLGPATVGDLDDATRRKRLAGAVHDAGWLELRDDAGDGTPLATGVESAIVADALGGAVADAAFSGPVVAADLLRRAGLPHVEGAVVAFGGDLIGAAVGTNGHLDAPVHVVDAVADVDSAYVLIADGPEFRLGRVRVDGQPVGNDITRTIHRVETGTAVATVEAQQHALSADDLARWSALGLALTSADLVGVMRGVVDVTVGYATERRQYSVPIGSFQAVQHLLAEAHTLMEGSFSVAQHAAWAVDALEPADALSAGRVAKAYCTRAARIVCETAIQVHGGIGNTWECVAHVYLRRALLSSQWFGDDAVHVHALANERLGVTDGLS
jgi:alkylation response protein AidB-like acyl-CoA dehydrogenase